MIPPPGAPFRFTTVAHAGRQVLGPISDGRLDEIVGRLHPAPGASVLEIGCGKGELLVRLLLARDGVTGIGIDRSRWFLADARSRAGDAGVLDRLTLVEADASSFAAPAGGVDLAISMGASGAIGTHAATLAHLAGSVRPGGGVLLGDGVWLGEPSADWMVTFGMRRDELPDGLEGQRALGTAAGLQPEWSEAVLTDEWDAYERAYAGAVERWAAANPRDAERDAFLARAAAIRESYAAWRRGVFGFGITLFRRG